jgi:hypothetical protein
MYNVNHMHEGHWGVRSMICSMSNVNHMHEGHRGIRSMICSTYNVNHMHGGKANKRCKCIMWIICIKGIEEYEVCYMIWALKNTRNVIWYAEWGILYNMQNANHMHERQGEQEVLVSHKRSICRMRYIIWYAEWGVLYNTARRTRGRTEEV